MTGPVDFSYRENAPPPEPPPDPVVVTLPPELPQTGDGGALLTPLADGGLDIDLGETAPAEPESEDGSDSTSNGIGAADGSAQTSLLAAASQRCAPSEQEIAAFFANHHDIVAQRAAEIGVDPTMLLGLAAYESCWGTSRQAQKLYNPFGATPGGDRPLQFGSNEEAWDWWTKKRFGPGVQGLGGDASSFIAALKSMGYNTEHADWPQEVAGVIRSVRRRLPQWLAGRGSPW